MKEEGFKDMLKNWWQGFIFRGSCNFIMAAKLKALQSNLKTWNKEVFGKVEVNKSLALQQVNLWDNQERSRALSVEGVEARKEARKEYEKWVLMEEIFWRQKSREVWLKEGDRTISFFHRMANCHKRRSNLTKIKINGTWLGDEHEIQGGVVSAFQHLLSDPSDWCPSLDGFVFERLEGEETTKGGFLY